MKGRGPRLQAVGKFIKRAHDFIRKHKLVSRGSAMASKMGYKPELFDKVGKVSGNLGYGRRRKGYGLRLAGSGLGLAGGSCRKYCRRRRR
jgi:hypothetical protein